MLPHVSESRPLSLDVYTTFVHPPAGGHEGCSHLWAAVNMGVQTSLRVLAVGAAEHTTRSGAAGPRRCPASLF